MTARMTTGEALNVIDELRAHRRPARVHDETEWRDADARVTLLLAAARTANDDSLVGDPHQVVTDLAAPTLIKREVLRWFSTLIEAVGELDQLDAWKHRTHGQHHADSAALDACIGTQVDRASLAVCVLLDGEPESQAVAA